MTARKTIEVAAAVVRREGRLLICSRPPDKPPVGWEFPGGKLEPGETAAQAAVRELAEELDYPVRALDTIYVLAHDYPEKRVRLHFVRCLAEPGAEPRPCEGQQCRFIAAEELPDCGLLAADRDFAMFLLDGERLFC